MPQSNKSTQKKTPRIGSIGRQSQNGYPVEITDDMLTPGEKARKGSFLAMMGNTESVLSQKQFEPIHEIVEVHSKPIFKLLKGFKLQQYAIKMIEMGFGEDIYKLAMLSHR